jgi:hypothetical protein
MMLPSRADRQHASSPETAGDASTDLTALIAEIRATRQLLAALDGLSAAYGSLFSITVAVARLRLACLDASLHARGVDDGNLLWFVDRSQEARALGSRDASTRQTGGA